MIRSFSLPFTCLEVICPNVLIIIITSSHIRDKEELFLLVNINLISIIYYFTLKSNVYFIFLNLFSLKKL